MSDLQEEGSDGYDCDAVPDAYRVRYWHYLADNCTNSEQTMSGKQFVAFCRDLEKEGRKA